MAGTLTTKTTCILILTLSNLATSFSQTEPCNSCCQGQSGIPGIPGAAGSSGAPGNNGSPGNNGLPGRDGLKGEAGIKGDSGEVGPPSERGFPGPSGQIGGPGSRGLQGLPGKVGPKGREGAPGTVGQPGPVGEKGSTPEAPMNLQSQSAFTVIKTSSETLRSNQVIIFQVVETNIGNHYDPSTNKFTCQIPGTYFFTFTITSNGASHHPYVYLKKDGSTVAAAYIQDSGTSDFMQASQSVVLQLNTGNQVSLQGGSGTVYSNSDKFTTFSGFLLYG